jgi:hypothetical protein
MDVYNSLGHGGKITLDMLSEQEYIDRFKAFLKNADLQREIATILLEQVELKHYGFFVEYEM